MIDERDIPSRPSYLHRPSPAGTAQLRVSFPSEAIIEKKTNQLHVPLNSDVFLESLERLRRS
jgi:hypothetical protein